MPKSASPFPDPACRLPDEYGLLAAVLASPHDDLPKLVYADWLEERGDPRGPFLRHWVLAKQARKPRPKPRRGIGKCWLSVVGYLLDAQLSDFGEPAWADAARQTAEPGILVRTKPLKGKALPTGASKMGGLPDLHPDTEWPEGERSPAAFVAQWNLAELATSPVCRNLPRIGLLSFLVDLLPTVEDSVAGDMNVIFTPSLDDLGEREPDEERDEENVLRECKVDLYERLTLPHRHSPVMDRFGLSDATLTEYTEWYHDWCRTELHHFILGHPQPVQSDPTAHGQKGWTLLTQFQPDRRVGLEAGEGGAWYFMTRSGRAKVWEFDDVHMEYQTG